MATFYIAKVPSKKKPWRLMKAEYQGGKAIQVTVPVLAYEELGFHPSMTAEEARARAKQLNAQGAIERKHQATVTRVAKRLEDDKLAHSAFIPQEINEKFLKFLDDNTPSKKSRSHWHFIKKMIIALELRPEEYADSKKQIYRYFRTKEISPAYVKKLLRILNLFGKFMCKYTKQYFDPVPAPKGHDREMINDAYLDKDGYFGPAEPLDLDTLSDLKGKLKAEQHDWLTLSVWFGLRPAEIDMLIQDRGQKHWRVEPGSHEVLWVFQPKLTSKPRHLRWKPIPILFDEQREALGILFKGGAIAPLTKVLKKHTGRQITLYSGRKGFVDLMLDRGQRLEDIAQWMGHSSIEMTWTKYKDRSKVHITPLSQNKTTKK